MKKTLLYLIISLFTASMFAQSGIQFPKSDTLSVKKVYPYILPFWGQKLTDRNIDFQLPFGINANYVYNSMELKLTHFSMSLNDGENFDEYLNAETLNFTETSAKTSGINIRADVWLLPFLNFYGIYAENNGSTKVALQPNIPIGDEGDIISLPYMDIPPAKFRSTTYGIGSTFVYGWNDYFISVDANYTSSASNLLEDRVGFVVASARIGRRVSFDNGMKLAVYFGAMYRDFVDQKGNNGKINLGVALPGLGENWFIALDNKLTSNQVIIDDPNSTPREVLDATKQNTLINEVVIPASVRMFDKVYGSELNYLIKKEIIQKWSTQIGFNFEITPNWMYRGELGYSSGQTFFMTGLQYRFGL